MVEVHNNIGPIPHNFDLETYLTPFLTTQSVLLHFFGGKACANSRSLESALGVILSDSETGAKFDW